MAQVDKSTIRTEVSRIKTDFEKLCSSGKINSETKFLMSSMFMIMELMLSIFLEKKTRKDNKNSSIPSSQTDKDESALDPHKGSNGKGKKESSKAVNNTRITETVSVIEVFNCNSCGEDLTDIESTETERRTKIDIVFEKVVEHVDAQIKQCPSCKAKTKGSFPSNLHGPLQYGNGLKAFVINLLVCQMVALNRVQKLVKSMMDVTLCEASLLKFVLRLHQALGQWETSAKEELLKMPAMNVDETSLRVDSKNHWIHVYSSGDITLKCLHKGRGIKAIDDIDIVPRYKGVIIHDCWASYFSYKHCGHGLCGSHLMRELTFIVDSNGYAWAKNMKKLLKETCSVVSKTKEKKLNEQDYKKLLKRFRNIMTCGEKEVELEEAYIQTLGLGNGLTFKAGRFLSAMGYLNEQHEHVWDFADAPLVYRGLFGNQLHDDGLQISYIAPTDTFLQFGAEIFSGSRFPAGGEHNGIGSWSIFAETGGDIGIEHSWQLGLSHWQANNIDGRSSGAHNHGGGVTETPSFSGDSKINALDLVYKWAPNGNPNKQNFKFQFEYFDRSEDGVVTMLNSGPPEEITTYDGNQNGWYAQAIYQFIPNWRTGLRYDQLDSDNKGSDNDVLAEAGLDNEGHTPKRYSTMLEWVPSEFSRVRLQFNHDKSYEETDNQVILQYTHSLGSHASHQY